tara:strand:- start:3800 stop:4954 length:1155 start_codon:yes stop_codon:yes gene_type:complete
MKKNILFISYMYLDSHLCKVSRFSILDELYKLDNKTYLHAAAISKNNILSKKNIYLSYVKLPGIQILNFIVYQIKSFFTIPKLIFSNNINFVICDINSTPSIILLLLLKKFRIIKVNFILDFRSNILHKRKNNIQNFLKNAYLFFILKISKFLYDGFTFITPSFKKYIENFYNLEFPQSIIWSSAVSDDFLNYPSRIILKPKKKFTLFHHGSLESGRGIMKLIEALPIISKNESIFVDLKIAGSGSLDKKIESLSKKIDNLFFLGRVDRKEVINYIDSASLCIVPFENSIGNATSSPLKVMEYLSRDKLILASKLPNFLNDFENYSGLLFMDNNNPKTIAKSVSNCIKNYENFIPKENEGKELIRDNFTWKIQAKKINLFLNKY